MENKYIKIIGLIIIIIVIFSLARKSLVVVDITSDDFIPQKSTYLLNERPAENFDMDTVAELEELIAINPFENPANLGILREGEIIYRPLNMTWLNAAGSSNCMGSSSGDFYDFKKNFSVSVWFRRDMFDDPFESLIGKELIDFNTGWKITRRSDTSSMAFYAVGLTINGIEGTMPVDDSQWHNLVATIDDNSIKLYIDSVLDVSAQIGSGLIIPNNEPVTVGCTANSRAADWRGDIDEVRIYDVSLSSVEVAYIFENNRYGKKNVLGNNRDNNQILYWSFNENHELNIMTNDLSEKGQDGRFLGNGGGSAQVMSWIDDGIEVDTLGYPVNISISNITRALIFLADGSVIRQDYTGDLTQQFLYKSSLYILDNFRLIEGMTRKFNPLSFNQSSDLVKVIASTLKDVIRTTVVINIAPNTCNNIKSISIHATKSGLSENILYPSDRVACSNAGKLKIEDIIIDNSIDSTIITINDVSVPIESSGGGGGGRGSTFLTHNITPALEPAKPSKLIVQPKIEEVKQKKSFFPIIILLILVIIIVYIVNKDSDKKG